MVTILYRMVVAQRRLNAEDWTVAALDAIGSHGLAGVAVEPLAAALGATKGSFYWHFANRDALVTAALARWDRVYTEEILAQVDAEPDPARRLRLLFVSVTATSLAPVETNLHAAADHPLVRPAVRRAVKRRTAYLGDLFEALGFSPEEATRRALFAYSAYLGHLQLTVRLPAALPPDHDAREAYLDTILGALLSP